MISIQFLAGYWTLCIDAKPLMSSDSLEKLVSIVPEAIIVNKFAVAA